VIDRNAGRVARISMFIAVALCAALVAPVGALAATWPTGVARIATDASRVSGATVYEAAVAGALRAYPEWAGVQHVVITSGETAARTDAAAASSLCWAYDAPLLLTARSSLPGATRDALAAIVSQNPSVTVHVVGSSTTIPAARLAQIVSAAGTATVEQPWMSASRYSLAASIAGRVREVAAANGSTVPTTALVVDGARSAHVWDVAVAASAARASGVPLLYVTGTTVPASTAAALAAAGHPGVIVVGGKGSVSSALYAKVGGAERWYGSSKSSTAVSVARHAVARGWSGVEHVALASTVSNAIVGGQLSGAKAGVLLLTDTARLSHVSWSYLAPRASSLSTAYAVGGPSIASAQVVELRGAPAKPWFASGAPGKYVGKKARVTGFAGGNTTTLALYVKGVKVRSATIKPWARFSFSAVSMPKTSAHVTAIAGNPDDLSTKATRTVHRLKYPFATCIVIDKSQFRLYWVKHNTLVRTFPIAIGRAGMETPPATWKILAKYHTSPGSVYGPRKMRLFRRSGGGWVFTRYGIHGTNQPWVIGTKASHGCIRMYNRDVLKLFPLVKMGTMVVTRP